MSITFRPNGIPITFKQERLAMKLHNYLVAIISHCFILINIINDYLCFIIASCLKFVAKITDLYYELFIVVIIIIVS